LKNPEKQYQNNSITLRPREKTDLFTPSRQAQLIKGSGLEASETATVYRCGPMVHAMRASGEITVLTVMENSFI
jgi:signal recognition particle GTPase